MFNLKWFIHASSCIFLHLCLRLCRVKCCVLLLKFKLFNTNSLKREDMSKERKTLVKYWLREVELIFTKDGSINIVFTNIVSIHLRAKYNSYRKLIIYKHHRSKTQLYTSEHISSWFKVRLPLTRLVSQAVNGNTNSTPLHVNSQYAIFCVLLYLSFRIRTSISMTSQPRSYAKYFLLPGAETNISNVYISISC